MKPLITVVGAGIVGTNLATAFQRAGRQVRFAAREPGSDKVRAAVTRLDVDVVPIGEGAIDSDLVVLAVPFAAVADASEALGDLGGSVLVDATNTVGNPLPGGVASIPEVILAHNPTATVVKAFNTIGAEAYLDPSIDGRPLFLPIAGDGQPAETVRQLAADVGFDAVVIGDLDAARILENFAELWIHLAFRTGLGRGFGFARLTR